MNLSKAAFPGAPVRADILEQIVTALQQGWCCAVVGPSNTGKSFLLKSLLTDEVRLHTAKLGALPPVMVFVDCLEAGDNEHAFYELLLRRTIETLASIEFDQQMLNTLRDLHRELLLHSQSDVAIRALYASSIRTLCQAANTSVVLILDEFYDIFQHLPPWPFRQLRALSDALEAKLSLVTSTSHFLENLRSDPEVYEFREMFHLHTFVLYPLTAPDAQKFVDYLAERHNDTVSAENTQRMIEISGGHPGLLERIYGIITMMQPDLLAPLDITINDIIKVAPIQKECLRLWSELEAEQEALLTLISGGQAKLDSSQQALLNRKGLLVHPPGKKAKLFSPLFRQYIETTFGPALTQSKTGVQIDPNTGQIVVDENEVTLKLSEPQRKLLQFLHDRIGMVCTYDEIAVGVWGIGEGVSPGAIYELVKRVRQKIEPDWKNPRYIVTVPGKGYRLEQ